MPSQQNLEYPLRWTPQEMILREERRIDGRSSRRSYGFNVVSDPQGESRAVVRELLDEGAGYTVVDRLRSFRILEEAGVAIAGRLPIQFTPDRTHMLVEYVAGNDLDTHPGSVRPDTLLSHAKSLGRYYCRALLEEGYVMVDITHPKQYRVRDGVPVLVDLDAYLNHADTIKPYQAAYDLDEITKRYQPLLPIAMGNELNQTIQSMKDEILY